METARYPLSVLLLGVMHKDKTKLFMTSVLWSDHNEIVVYRSFREFKAMHREMKKSFPPANKLRKADRIVPRFRDKKVKQSSPRKGPNKSLAYLKFLQDYSNELLTSDPRVSQSADLIRFFHPRDQDLQPDLAKNSIMVMPSSDDIRSHSGHSGGGGGGGNVTQPFVTETYRCVAPYETKDTKNKTFKVEVDEKVDVLIKDKAGWWLVEKEDKRMAWFPAPYLEKMEEEGGDGDDEEGAETPERGVFYIAVRSYKASKVDEISVNVGAVVEVMQRSENGWWLIRYSGKVGYIPTMHLQPYSHPHMRMSPTSPSLSPLLSPSSNLQRHPQLSLSQGNLLLQPSSSPSSSSPRSSPRSSPPLHPDSKQRSRSMNVLSEPPPPPPPDSSPSLLSPLPTITVQLDEEEEEEEREDAGGRGLLRADSEGSFVSDSTDFSFSDDLSSSSAGSSSLNLSPGAAAKDDWTRLSRTPPPPSDRNRLSPTSGAPPGRLVPSVSDPNLYQGPRSPKVPPRPQTQQILARCTTITRKNAARGGRTPTQAEILSR